MKKRYESKWEGPGLYRVWEIKTGKKLKDWHRCTEFRNDGAWDRKSFVYRKIELPPEPEPVIEFEPGLYRVRSNTGNWVYREREPDGRSTNACGEWMASDFDTAYTAYQKLEPGEIIETK